jgi:hypothetical protein
MEAPPVARERTGAHGLFVAARPAACPPAAPPCARGAAEARGAPRASPLRASPLIEHLVPGGVRTRVAARDAGTRERAACSTCPARAARSTLPLALPERRLHDLPLASPKRPPARPAARVAQAPPARPAARAARAPPARPYRSRRPSGRLLGPTARAAQAAACSILRPAPPKRPPVRSYGPRRPRAACSTLRLAAPERRLLDPTARIARAPGRGPTRLGGRARGGPAQGRLRASSSLAEAGARGRRSRALPDLSRRPGQRCQRSR